MATKTKNEKAKRPKLAEVRVIDTMEYWQGQFYEEFGKKLAGRARDAVLNWLRRTFNEIANMMNVINHGRIKEGFTQDEREKLSGLFDKLWREMTDTVEEFAVPAELTAVSYVPAFDRRD